MTQSKRDRPTVANLASQFEEECRRNAELAAQRDDMLRLLLDILAYWRHQRGFDEDGWVRHSTGRWCDECGPWWESGHEEGCRFAELLRRARRFS